MKSGAIINIPDAVASRANNKETVQPGIPGRWSVWSPSDACPGAYFVTPVDEAARALGVKYATVKITEPEGETARIRLLDTEPSTAMPKTWTERIQ